MVTRILLWVELQILNSTAQNFQENRNFDSRLPIVQLKYILYNGKINTRRKL